MKINWIKIGDDDFKAIPEEGHMLRVEQLNKKMWWWCASIKTWATDCWADGNPGKKEKQAKILCEAAYKKLLSESNNV